jgi:glutamate-ammonia-ligase adenylyltransferase
VRASRAPLRLPPFAAEAVAASAHPSLAEVGLSRVIESVPGAMDRLEADGELLGTIVRVVAASPFLTRALVTEPAAFDVLSSLSEPVAPLEPLERWKALEVLRIAAADLSGSMSLEAVGEALADLADGLLGRACDRIAANLAVIGLGKLGARELNYGSDIDIVLVGDPGTEAAARSLLALLRPAWRVDLALRPEGRAGPLVRSLASYEAYWDRWAEAWEFQALLKARALPAGEEALGRAFVERAAERLWARPLDSDDLRKLRAMKARAEELVERRGLSGREVKLGRGGIRDIEFAAQLLQLVHGRQDPSLRVPATLGALSALAAGGYIDPGDAGALGAAYRFLRAVEHCLQLFEDRQVHTLPAGLAERARLAKVMGYRDGPSSTALSKWEADLAHHQAAARAVHERLFFRPLLEAFTARGPGIGEGAIGERLAAFGFSDARRTREAVVELTQGLSRTSRLMQAMVPLLLDWLSESPDPDLGLLGLRRLATGQHRRGQLAPLFRDSPEAARNLCLLLGTSPLFAAGYERHPEQLALLEAGPPPVPSRPELERRAAEVTAWRPKADRWRGLLGLVKAETLRAQARDVLGLAAFDETARSLTALAEAVLSSSLGLLAGEDCAGVAIVAMGRFGGAELSYASDLDLLFVFDDEVVPPAEAEHLAEGWLRLVGGQTPVQRLYRLDFSLRPEGRKGALARSLRAFEAYYGRWAQVWERQALLRGRFVAGDPSVGERFSALASEFVWGRGLTDEEVREIRRLKARVERERVPPGEDPEFHLKLGPGALADVEWTVQLLQLESGTAAAGGAGVGRAEGTLDALEQLVGKGALGAAEAAVLGESYRFCERARNRLYLVKGGPGDSLPGPGQQLTTLARSLGTTAPELRDQYRRLTRRARRVVERLFYGAG